MGTFNPKYAMIEFCSDPSSTSSSHGKKRGSGGDEFIHNFPRRAHLSRGGDNHWFWASLSQLFYRASCSTALGGFSALPPTLKYSRFSSSLVSLCGMIAFLRCCSPRLTVHRTAPVQQPCSRERFAQRAALP